MSYIYFGNDVNEGNDIDCRCYYDDNDDDKVLKLTMSMRVRMVIMSVSKSNISLQ